MEQKIDMSSPASQFGALHTPSEQTDNSNFDYLTSTPSSSASRSSLSSTAFSALFDTEGRLVDEHVFRQNVFEGGIEVVASAADRLWVLF